MQKATYDSILLLGNHANLFKKELNTFIKLPVRTLSFKKKQSYIENDPHQLHLDQVSIDYNGNYNLEELVICLIGNYKSQ